MVAHQGTMNRLGLALLTALTGTLLARTELVHLRTENSRTFDNGDRTRRSEVGPTTCLYDTASPVATGWVHRWSHHGEEGYADGRQYIEYEQGPEWLTCGWMKFYIGALTDTGIVTQVTLGHYQYYVSDSHVGSSLAHVAADPDSIDRRDLFWAVAEGEPLDTISTHGYPQGWVVRNLNPRGIQLVDSVIRAGKEWLTLGIVAFSWWNCMGRSYGMEGDSLRPFLAVTYRTSDIEHHHSDWLPSVLQLAPNPAKETAWLHGLRRLPHPALLEIADASGRSVLRRRLAATEAAQPLDLRHLPTGVYLVRLEAEGFAATQKLVIQH
jgi:hypothetical protein